MYTIPGTFARRELELGQSDYAVLGIPFDSSESYRTGSRFGPDAIREASRDLEDYDLEEHFDLLDLQIADLGNLEVSFGNYEETLNRSVYTLEEIRKNGAVPIILGGEHTITYFGSKVMPPETLYVIYDAHTDYREDYLENTYSHASVTRRIAEEAGPENILLIGVRSGSKEEIDGIIDDEVTYIGAREFNNDKEKAFAMIREKTKDRKVYVSFDMDVFDPSEARGVGNPEPGGLYFRDIVESLDFLQRAGLEGLDVNELTPSYDPYSQILAAKLLFKTLVKANRA